MDTVTRLKISGYGKLPLSREYVRLDCRKGVPLVFQYFVDQAAPWILKSLRGEESLQLCTVLRRFQSVLIAEIWPSKDEGGMRPFPFSYFTAIEMSAFQTEMQGLWTRLRPLFSTFHGLYTETRALRDRDALLRHLEEGGKYVPGPMDIPEAVDQFQKEAASLKVHQWAEEAFGSSSEPFLISLWRVVSAFKKSRLGKTNGIRLPLSRVCPIQIQVDAWVSYLTAFGMGVPKEPQLLVSPGMGNTDHVLTVFFRSIEPADLAVLENAARVKGIVDVTIFKEPASLEGYNGFADRVQQILSNGLTMDRFSDLVEI